MTVQRYSIKEALNRIYRIFRGDTLSNDAIGSLDGEVYSEDEALSRFAELVQGSLPGESFALPVGTPSTPYVHGHLIGLAVYDDASFIVSGTALVFTDNIFVTVSGTNAYIGQTGTSGGGYTEGARVYNSTGIAINNTTPTFLSFDSELYDTDSIHSGSSQQLYCNTAGKYLISANVKFSYNNSGRRILYIILNDSTNIGEVSQQAVTSSVGQTVMNLSTIYDLSEDDYIKVKVYQDSGSAVNIEAEGNLSPEFMMQRIG